MDIPETWPQDLYTAEQARQVDAELIAAGTPGFELMQRAAQAVWRAIGQHWPEAGVLTVVAGAGNNAGDGYLVAVLAARAGWQVQVYACASPDALLGDAARAYAQAQAMGISILAWRERCPMDGILVDAVLGTGLHGEVRPEVYRVLRDMQSRGLPIVAVDIPSGLCADSGQPLGCALRAQITVTFIVLKIGLFTGLAADYLGRLYFDDLGADSLSVEGIVNAPVRRLNRANLPRLTPRPRAAHKGQFGHVLVVGGDLGMGGAVMLCAETALRLGAGKVSLATRAGHVNAALTRCPEIMVHGIDSGNQLGRLLDISSVRVVGPGLGLCEWSRSLFSAAVGVDSACGVLDADALTLLAQNPRHLQGDWVMTPHPGEAARLLGCSVAEVQADRVGALTRLAGRYGCVVVLKGWGTLVGSGQGTLWCCDEGHPAMAGPGMGDVLSGVIAALLAQGLEAEEAARLGVWLHARAGRLQGAFGRGLLAGDLLPQMRSLLEEHSPCLE